MGTMTDGFLEFQGQGGVLWTGILKVWGNTYIWNSEGLKMLISRTLPVRTWSTKERRDTDDDHESAGYRRSIDWSGMCWRKSIKLGLYIKFINFLMMNIRLIKYKQIFLRVCTANIDVHALVRIRWTAKTHPGGGGYSKKFYTGRLCPGAQPLPLLHAFF